MAPVYRLTKKFYPKVIEAAKAGDLTIEYIDNDRDGSSSTPDEKPAAKPAATGQTYVVKSGESLSVLAKKFNTTQEKLLADNAGKVKNLGLGEGV